MKTRYTMRKGISVVVAAVIYTAILVVAIGLILNVGLPLIEEMRDAAAVDEAQQFLSDLDNTIREVASEGEGSARTISLQFDRGRYVFDEDDNAIIYELDTTADIIPPHSSRRIGNLVLSSEANASVTKTSVEGTDCFMMENAFLEACIREVGSRNNYSGSTFNTTDLLIYYHNKDLNRNWTAPSSQDGNLSVFLWSDANTPRPSSQNGTMWTEALETGGNLGIAEIVAHVKVAEGALENLQYRIRYQLWSGSDFLVVRVEPDA